VLTSDSGTIYDTGFASKKSKGVDGPDRGRWAASGCRRVIVTTHAPIITRIGQGLVFRRQGQKLVTTSTAWLTGGMLTLEPARATVGRKRWRSTSCRVGRAAVMKKRASDGPSTLPNRLAAALGFHGGGDQAGRRRIKRIGGASLCTYGTVTPRTRLTTIILERCDNLVIAGDQICS